MASLAQPSAFVDGAEHSSNRTLQLSRLIKDYQFVCGQEVDGATARRFAQLLKGDYAEFYTYAGKSNLPWAPSGLFFASKEKVLDVKFYPYQGGDNSIFIQRGLILFELENYYVATTHLDSGQDPSSSAIRLKKNSAGDRFVGSSY